MSRPLRMIQRPGTSLLFGVGIWAAAVACCLLLLSPVVTPLAAKHDCTGNGCAVCAVLIANGHLSDAAKPAPIALAHVAGRDMALQTAPPALVGPTTAVTLVSQKIKLTI